MKSLKQRGIGVTAKPGDVLGFGVSVHGHVASSGGAVPRCPRGQPPCPPGPLHDLRPACAFTSPQMLNPVQ